MEIPHSDKKRICVIGAGPAGLCAARHLSSRPAVFDVDVFDQADRIGGTWVYRESVDDDEFGQPVYNSMYQNLITNTPACVTHFPDYPFGRDMKDPFVHHTDMLRYFNNYADRFQLHQYMNLRHRVCRVTRADGQWQVTVKELKTGLERTQSYYGIIVANGIYSKPRMPTIAGMDTFTGSQIHAHLYRTPDFCTGRNVIVLGGFGSGIDIVHDTATVARSVYLIHQQPFAWLDLPDNVEEISTSIESVSGSAVTLKNGRVLADVEVIIMATGYRYSYPFLDADCGIAVSEENHVKGLYMQLINVQQPTMVVMGIMQAIMTFPIFHQQMQVVTKVWAGDITLPSQAEMIADTDRDIAERATRYRMPERKWHLTYGAMLCVYNKKLAKLGSIVPICDARMKIYSLLIPLNILNSRNGKKSIFTVDNDHEFTLKVFV